MSEQNLEQVMKGLSPDDAAHWTQDGKADLNVLKERMGRQVKAAERDAIGWTREDADKAKGESNGTTEGTDGDAASSEIVADGGTSAPETVDGTAAAAEGTDTADGEPRANPTTDGCSLTPIQVLELAGGDAIVLVEALALAVGAERYRRNSPLQQLVQHYRAEQKAVKDWQDRIDARAAREGGK